MDKHSLIKFIKRYDAIYYKSMAKALKYDVTLFKDSNNALYVELRRNNVITTSNVRIWGYYNKTTGIWTWADDMVMMPELSWMFQKNVKISYEDHTTIPYFISIFMPGNLVRFIVEKDAGLFKGDYTYGQICIPIPKPVTKEQYLSDFNEYVTKN